MSYILEALRKSEQDRKKGEVPDLNTIQGPISSPLQSGRHLWPYLLSAGLLISVIVLVPWLILRQPDTGDIPQAGNTESIETGPSLPTSAETNAPPLIPTSPTVEEIPPQVSKLASQTIDDTSVAGPESKTPPANVEETTDSITIIATDQEDPGQDFLPEPAEIPEEKPAREAAEIIPFENLPASVAGELPSLSISAHYFASDPDTRMASINGRVMRQGQKIAGGLTLEEITRTGVIISFEKYRFGIDVFKR